MLTRLQVRAFSRGWQGARGGGGGSRSVGVSVSAALVAAAAAIQLYDTDGCGSAGCTAVTPPSPPLSLPPPPPPAMKVEGRGEFSSIVVGGGTAGCLTAYLQAKWMQDRGIKGTVLLIERGDDYSSKGPNPRMEAWYDNWGIFGEAHQAVRQDQSPYPVTGFDHRGLGGCSTHDTRITFQPTRAKKRQLAEAMAWPVHQLDEYYQAALNMIPIERAILKPEKYYQDVISALTTSASTSENSSQPLKRLEGNHFDTKIVVDSVAENSVAMFSDENRWCSALLTKDGIRPSNMVVLTNVTADRVLFSGDEKADEVSAVGVVVRDNTGKEMQVKLEEKGLLAVTGGAIGTAAILQRSGVGPRALLDSLGIACLVPNEEVGHGVDHPEVSLLYAWNTDLAIPRGGSMGWPLSLFVSTPPDERNKNSFVHCHFGAGHADPYVDSDAVVVTPSCTEPDHSAGFKVRILSKDPGTSTELVHAEQTRDMLALYNGLTRTADVCKQLQRAGLAGERIVPPPEIDLGDVESKSAVIEWIRDNHFTVYHWACTCTAGVQGRVADKSFRLLRKNSTTGKEVTENVAADLGAVAKENVVKNMFIGSAASLPTLPEANPHLTISAFSFALADSMHKERCRQLGVSLKVPAELLRAREVLGGSGVLTTTARGEEVPRLDKIASAHAQDWKSSNQ
jgi:choline dehydrogenase-like flavoprotein